MEGKKPNVLQILASRRWGGGEQYVLDLSKELIENGYGVHFVHRKSRIIETKLSSIDNLSSTQARLTTHIDIFSILRLSTLIKRYDINIVHVHQFKDAFLISLAKLFFFKKRKLAIVLTRHLVSPAKVSWPYRILYQHLNKIIFVSNLARDRFLFTNPPIDSKKIEVLYNSVYINKEAKHRYNNEGLLKAKYGILPSTTIIGYSGRLVVEKGIFVLLDTMALLQELDIHLFVAGLGNQRITKEINEKIVSLGLEKSVTLLGFVDQIDTFIEQIDIGVFPSIWQEPFGLAILEFMMMEKAVVTTNNGAQSEFINGGEDGLLINPDSVSDLKDAIKKLVLNPSYREKIGTNAKKTFYEKLNYSIFFNRIENLYREISPKSFKYQLLVDLSKLGSGYCGLWEFSYRLGESLIKSIDFKDWGLTLIVPRNHPYKDEQTNYIIYNKNRWINNVNINYSRFDVIHFTTRTNLIFIHRKVRKTVVMTIHDLNFLYEKTNIKIRKYMNRNQKSIQNISNIVAISSFAKQDILTHIDLKDVDISVIYNGVTVNTNIEKRELDVFKQLKTSKYMFIISTVMRKKNMHTLVDMLEFVKDYSLIIAGQTIHADYRSEIIHSIKEKRLEDRVFILGSITEEEKAILYSRATAFVFPSIAEGFGIPPIEAMAFGLPVFVSNRTSIPEICGDMAIYWKNFEPKYMAEVFEKGMIEFNNNPSRKEELKEYVKKYSWDICVTGYVDIYKQIAKKNSKVLNN